MAVNRKYNLDAVNPQAVAAFGSIAEHLPVVEAAAPRGIHVMVEKPLAFSVEDADKMEALAKRHGIHVLTNYETTWYASGYTAFQLVHGDKAVGPIRKMERLRSRLSAGMSRKRALSSRMRTPSE